MAAILDSHSEIIVSDEFNLLYEFNSFLMDPSQTDDERKLRIFFELHAAHIDRPGLEIVHQTALVHTATTLMEVGKETQGDFFYIFYLFKVCLFHSMNTY